MQKNKNERSVFCGIDIAKEKFDVEILDQKQSQAQYPNTQKGWKNFYLKNAAMLKNGIAILEATGGYEHGLLMFLVQKKVAVHRADTRKVKHYIKSFGVHAKTDKIDAYHLAKYGKDRVKEISFFKPQSENLVLLKEFVARYQELIKTIAQEKTRAQQPMLNQITASSIKRSVLFLQKEIDLLKTQITDLINASAELKQKQNIIKTIPGIGQIVSQQLLCLLPELGYLNRKEIASLSGLAPHPKDSGKHSAYRSTAYGGRQNVKTVLHLAALAASNSHSILGDFYSHLIQNGKKPLVALTALKRKIIVIANAKIRDDFLLTCS